MVYNLHCVHTSIDFDELKCGELFVDHLQNPYIKIPILISENDVRIRANAIRLSSGCTQFFEDDATVWRPSEYKIDITV